MIYYPISVLMLAGIKDILLISTPSDINGYKRLFKDGSDFGINISYEIQDEPEGIAQAFIIGENFIGNDNVCLILGDNIFYGQAFSPKLKKAASNSDGATIFSYQVRDPENFGVLEVDSDGKIVSIVEKPLQPKSNLAITGLYFYDNDVVEISKNISPSKRGELEITSINNEYLKRGKLNNVELGRGFAWLDTGTHESLIEASSFVRTIERIQGNKIACLEEIAFHQGWLSADDLREKAKNVKMTSYSEYFLNLIK